jgi:hypothetical protein
MKRLALILVLVSVVVGNQRATAQDLFQIIQQQALDSLRANSKPVVQVFGEVGGGGLYHSASTHGILGFDVGVQGMMAFVPSGKSQIMDQAGISRVPLPVVQGNLGLPMDFGVMIRGISYKYQGQTLSLFGVGLKKDFSPLIPIPMFPHIGAMVAYHSFKGGDILSANVVSLDLMASESFLVVEPYIGVGFDRTSIKFTYTYTNSGTSIPIDEKFAESTTRLTLGLKFSPLPLVQAFADYNVGKFNSVTAGLAVSFR